MKTVPEAGWRTTKDAGLLRMADGSFDVFVTIDRNMERQDVSSLRLGLIIAHVRSNRLVDFQPVLSDLAEAVGKIKPGEVIHVRAARG